MAGGPVAAGKAKAAAASASAANEAGEGEEAPPAPRRGRRAVLLAVPVLLLAIAGGLWASGLLPRLLGAVLPGMFHHQPAAAAAAPKLPVFVDLPELVTNLNVATRRQSYAKLHAKLELEDAADMPLVQAAMPRIQDLFQTYIRDLRPEELRGSAGSYRLREELLNRAGIAVAPARIRDVLFVELLIE